MLAAQSGHGVAESLFHGIRLWYGELVEAMPPRTIARSRRHVEDVSLAYVTLLPKVRIALSEKRIPWEPIYVNLRAVEHKTPEFLALNPYGKVPVLLDEGAVIYESTVVNEYLEDRFPEPPLMPTDP
jgi:Glutathione S-transferase, N-terminal domain